MQLSDGQKGACRVLRKYLIRAIEGRSNELIQHGRFERSNSAQSAEVGGHDRKRVCPSVGNAGNGVEYVS
jgi:hypothetical protein